MNNVEHPSHYVHGEHDLLYHLKDILTPEEYRGAMKFNIIKYAVRFQDKNGAEDLKKMLFYGQDLLDYENKKEDDNNSKDNKGIVDEKYLLDKLKAGHLSPFDII